MEWMDWSLARSGNKFNNSSCAEFCDQILEGETVEVVVNWTLGTVGFFVHGKYKQAF